MYKRVLNPIVFTALSVLMTVPAVAQIRADIGPLHIRIATDAPPRVRVERRLPRPDRDSIWIGGYWDRQDDQWAWAPGRWDRPHSRNVRWIRPRYSREGCSWYNRKDCAWRYEPGHWSNQQVVEGDDYRNWRSERRSNRDRRN